MAQALYGQGRDKFPTLVSEENEGRATVMMTTENKYEVYAILWVSGDCEEQISRFLHDEIGVRKGAIQKRMHLTVYYGKKPLPGLMEGTSLVHITANTDETRFMVFAPGGENPRTELIPGRRSVGIRLTKRNKAIDEIQQLRKSVYRLETQQVVGRRHRTTPWRNCFGARNYQPHIKLLQPGNQVGDDLTIIGRSFRDKIDLIEFDRFETLSSAAALHC